MNEPANGDPRRDPGQDIRPVVATPPGGLPLWAIATAMLLAGLVLFSVLEARRRGPQAPATAPRYLDETQTPNQAAALFIPPEPVATPATQPTPIPSSTPRPQPLVQQPPEAPRAAFTPTPPPQLTPPQGPPVAARSGPALVVDTGEGAAAPPTASREADGSVPGSGATATAARATVMGHRATLVAQGTLIAAVLETALDSTRAGPSRALVTRDVRGFDGSTVLIPRGSRLFGDAHSDVQPGQNRALITWTRLIRPDGVTIAIGSPSADPLGRIGVRGKVNSHFFERFSGAILQSALNIGVNLASRAASRDSAVVVALPSTLQNTTQPLTTGTQIQPTLRVRQGTAITVFVARDLDFTAVQARR